jgi:hypothetical protein
LETYTFCGGIFKGIAWLILWVPVPLLSTLVFCRPFRLN